MANSKNSPLLLLALAAALGFQQAHAQARLQLFDKSQFRPGAQSLLRVQNDLIAVQVRATNDTSVLGEITYAGIFNIGTAGDRPLLFKFPDAPLSSHVNIRVDNAFYSNDPQRTNSNLLRLLSARLAGDSTIECSYQAGPIAVLQRLTPQKFSTTTGAIFIEYLLHNTDPVNNHQAGVLLELDTYVNGNDQAPVLTKFGYSRFEQKFVAPQIPDFFQAFQVDNPADSTGLVAQGTLLGYNAVRPDQLIIGNWANLAAVQWDYTVAASPPRYDDSAVILRWNEQNLAPNQTRTVATYFGLGDVTTKRDAASGLTLHLTALRNLRARQGQLTPNPFEINLLVFNRTNPAVNSVQATLFLPPSLALASGDFAAKLLAPSNLNTVINNGTASWTVVAQCPPAALDAPIRVAVSGLVGANAINAEMTRPLFLPSCLESQPAFRVIAEPPLQSVIPGGKARFKVFITPLFGFNQLVQLDIFPDTPGIAALLSPRVVFPTDTASLELQADRNALAGDYSFVINAAAGAVAASDSLILRVAAADLAPPYLANFNPARDAVNVPLQAGIAVDVLDDLSGVDSASVRMQIFAGQDTLPIVRSMTRIANGFRVRAAPLNPFRDRQLIRVAIAASDLAAPPLALTPVPYSFTTVADTLAPVVLDLQPARDARNVPRDAEIRARLRDDLTGVDSASIRLLLHGRPVTPLLRRESGDWLLAFKPADPFAFNDTIAVQIEAADIAAQPNAGNTAFSFYILEDRRGPVVTDHVPAPFAANVPPQTKVEMTLRDEPAGVDSAAIRLRLNGDLVKPAITGSPQQYRLSYTPDFKSREMGDTVRVAIESADLASPANRMPAEEYYFVLGQDRSPPFVAARNPAPRSSNVPIDAEVSVILVDLQSGVDLQTLTMAINGQTVQPRILGDRFTLDLRYKPAAPWPFDAAVHVSVRAQDLAVPPNVMPPDTFSFSIAPLQPDLIAGDLQATETFALGQPATVKGTLQADRADINQLFQVAFYADGERRNDTTITALAAGTHLELATRLRFDTPGTHIAEMVIDAGNAVVEFDENNNRKQLVINLAETISARLLVRPNPFTPNNDGYNDVVEFNFAGLNLDRPTLHIFDANGIPVWSNQPQTGKVYSWNGRDKSGHELQPGVYLYSLQDKGHNVASGYVVLAR